MNITSSQALINRIQVARQVAREDQSRAIFPTILNDVMVELGWTEQQAAKALDTTESTVRRWMAGRNIPTWSVCETSYQHMIVNIVERDAINEMTQSWIQQQASFSKHAALVFGLIIIIGVVVWLTFG